MLILNFTRQKPFTLFEFSFSCVLIRELSSTQTENNFSFASGNLYFFYSKETVHNNRNKKEILFLKNHL